MLRKSLAVFGLLSAMTLASPAGALSWDGGFFGNDRGSSLRFSGEGSSFLRFFPTSRDGLGSWNAPSRRGERDREWGDREFRPGRRHPFTIGTPNCSEGAGRRCGPRPGSAVPEPGAALLFGAGALLVGRRLRSS